MISFQLEEDQKILRDTLEGFAQNEIRAHSQAWDDERALDGALLQKGAALGLLPSALTDLEEGNPQYWLNHLLALEALAWGDLGFTLALYSGLTAALPIALFGSAEQKEKYLSDYRGETFVPGAAALCEPRYFFDMQSLQAKAVKNAKEWLLQGEKTAVSFAKEAPFVLFYAREDDGGGLSSIRGYLLEKGCGGVKVQEEKFMGFLALPTYTLSVDRVPCKAEQRVGNGSFAFGRIAAGSYLASAACAVGTARASYEYAREYAKTRVAFNEPIASRQAIAFMIAEAAIEVDAARLLSWEAAWQYSVGEGTLRRAYEAKRYAAEMALAVCDRGVQILGGHGYIREHPAELWLRNARSFACLEGIAAI